MLQHRKLKPGGFVEVLEAHDIQKREPVHLEHVRLHPELHRFVLLASFDGPDVGLVERDDPVLQLFGLVVQQECLLRQHFFDGFQVGEVLRAHEFRPVDVQGLLKLFK